MRSLNRALASGAPYAPVVMRVILGVFLVWHGVDKFDTGMENVEGFFDSNGVPLAGVSAWFVAIAEIVIGGALILGIATRIAAFVQILILVGAIIFVKLTPIPEGGFLAASELDFIYIAGLIGVMLFGAGKYSVDEAINMDDTVIDLTSKADQRTFTNA